MKLEVKKREIFMIGLNEYSNVEISGGKNARSSTGYIHYIVTEKFTYIGFHWTFLLN